LIPLHYLYISFIYLSLLIIQVLSHVYPSLSYVHQSFLMFLLTLLVSSCQLILSINCSHVVIVVSAYDTLLHPLSIPSFDSTEYNRNSIEFSLSNANKEQLALFWLRSWLTDTRTQFHIMSTVHLGLCSSYFHIINSRLVVIATTSHFHIAGPLA